MSIKKFTEEFTHLITRWTRSQDIIRDGATILVPLTKREIVNSIKLVVQMTMGVYFHETTQAGIAASRPSSFAESFRYRSMEDLLPSSDSSNVRSLNAILTSQSPYMKVISKSSPTIHVSFLDRPDAGLREEAERDALQFAPKQQVSNMKSRELLNRIKVLRNSAADVIHQIDYLRKEVCPQSRIPRPQLPPIATPGPSGSSLLPRKVPRSILRKPSSGFSGTSATKKFDPIAITEKEMASAMHRALSHGTIFIKPLEMPPLAPVAGSSTMKSPPSTRPTVKTLKSAPTRGTMPKFPLYRKSFL